MRMSKRIALGTGLGIAAFIVSHIIIVAKWGTWFDGAPEHWPYWMNSASRSPILFTLGNVLVTAAMPVGLWMGEPKNVDGTLATFLIAPAAVAVGATMAMVVVLFTQPQGPGTLFPIAIAVGGLILFVGAFVGSVAAIPPWYLWRLARSNRR